MLLLSDKNRKSVQNGTHRPTYNMCSVCKNVFFLFSFHSSSSFSISIANKCIWIEILLNRWTKFQCLLRFIVNIFLASSSSPSAIATATAALLSFVQCSLCSLSALFAWSSHPPAEGTKKGGENYYRTQSTEYDWCLCVAHTVVVSLVAILWAF